MISCKKNSFAFPRPFACASVSPRLISDRARPREISHALRATIILSPSPPAPRFLRLFLASNELINVAFANIAIKEKKVLSLSFFFELYFYFNMTSQFAIQTSFLDVLHLRNSISPGNRRARTHIRLFCVNFICFPPACRSLYARAVIAEFMRALMLLYRFPVREAAAPNH